MDDAYSVTETLYEAQGSRLYRAVRATDQRPVILKTVDPKRSPPGAAERLKHEYETMSALDTRAVATPLALEMHRGLPALVLEDFGGESLDHGLGAPMAVEAFLRLAKSIAAAVAEIHQRGVIHKDLKPQNILLRPSTGEVRLIDFEIASRLPREQKAPQSPERIEGSLPYMAPEQTGRMNRVVDSRSDLYSLGVTFYQMLTGRLPFDARDPA